MQTTMHMCKIFYSVSVSGSSVVFAEVMPAAEAITLGCHQLCQRLRQTQDSLQACYVK